MSLLILKRSLFSSYRAVSGFMWWVWRQITVRLVFPRWPRARGCSSITLPTAHTWLPLIRLPPFYSLCFLHAWAQRDHNACTHLAARHQLWSHLNNTPAAVCYWKICMWSVVCEEFGEDSPCKSWSFSRICHSFVSASLSVSPLPFCETVIFLSEMKQNLKKKKGD